MLPEILTAIPGPQSQQLAAELREYESHNVTFVAEDWPIFWERASGTNVWDVDGNRFIDITSAFGVSGLGHTHAPLCEAMQQQASELMHAMGDVHPTRLKVDVCKKLSAMTFERWGMGVGKTVLSNSGFEAVETALKTAYVATNKPGIISFDGGYHGLGYGALLGSGFDKFKKPFEAQLAGISYQLTFPTNEQELEEMCSQLGQINSADVGAILVEPIQGRGGKKVPPEGFLKALREWSDNEDVVLIFDEIYSGLNRSGKLFACEWEGVFPDLLCVGKALSGGYPISACIGKSEVMDKWPVSTGEALHTSTFLGNPVGCAMANVALDLHRDPALADDVLKQGEELMVMLRELDSPWISEIRGRGLMIGMELRNPTTGSPAGAEVGAMLGDLLKQGIIMLADGPEGNVLAFTPPFHLKLGEMVFLVAAIKKELSKLN